MLFSLAASAAETFGVFNVKQIFESSPQAKSISESLKSQFAPRKADIVTLSKKLQEEIKSYEKNQSVMDKKSLKDLQKNINEHSIQLRQQQSQFQSDLLTAQNKKMDAFVQEVKTAVAKIATKKNLSLVLLDTAVLYSKKGLDITPEVLQAMK